MFRLLFGILLVVLGVTTALIAIQFIPPLAWQTVGVGVSIDLTQTSVLVRGGWLGCGIILIAMGILLLVLGAHNQPQMFVLRPASDGNASTTGISVSRRAVMALLSAAAHRTPGVRTVELDVSLERRGWRINGDLSLFQDSHLRDTCDLVANQLREALERHTGLDVLNVNIRADAHSDGTRVS